MLYLVGTPIGNLGDMSPRAKEILESADIIACEDTRRTGLLLSEFGISGQLVSYHEHNKASKGNILLEELKSGKIIAQVSDAGMPSVSDPGEDLVKLCIENNIPVSVIPGPVAGITALVMSGLDTRRYHFEGFLPSETKPRKERLSALQNYEETIIIYEAPHRLMKLIAELNEYGFGDSRAAFCREMTKKYEEVIRLTVSEALAYFEENPPKGEFVVCVAPRIVEKKEYSQSETDELIYKFNKEGLSKKDISKKVSAITGKNKKEIYDYIVNLIE
ncbi:MAG: 16S rRNA (cytidine(1402)-2'-O)-methyltransferase [Clostridia bacterium]|nr:16S rRNA (cytidine(1402)-2'-O)-methyltransferase [Clostridia bacterium]